MGSPLAEQPGLPPWRTSLIRVRRSAALLVVLTMAANVVNYASSLIFSRVLGPVGFGELTSLLALSVVLAVPLGAAQTIVAERIARAAARNDHAAVRYLIRHALGHVAVLGVACGLLYAASIPLVMSVLDVREPGPAVAVIPLLVLSFINPVTQGALQGLQKFTAFGVLIFATAVSRLVFGVPWALSGGGAGGAIAGQALGIAAVTAWIAWVFRGFLIGRGTGAAKSGMTRRINRPAIEASSLYIGFAVLTNLDVLLARVFLDPETAGIYAAVSTVGKVVLFLPTALATVVVPRAVNARAAGGSGHDVLRRSALFVGLSAGVCIVPGLLAPGLVIDVMFGDEYEAARSGVLPMCLAGAGAAMLYVLMTYAATIRQRGWSTLLLGGVVLQVVSICLFHDSVAEVAWAQAATVLIVLLVNEVLLIPLRRTRKDVPQ